MTAGTGTGRPAPDGNGPAPRGRPASVSAGSAVAAYCFLSVKSPVTVSPFLTFSVVATGR